jgi:hypothetical protein
VVNIFIVACSSLLFRHDNRIHSPYRYHRQGATPGDSSGFGSNEQHTPLYVDGVLRPVWEAEPSTMFLPTHKEAVAEADKNYEDSLKSGFKSDSGLVLKKRRQIGLQHVANVVIAQVCIMLRHHSRSVLI